MHIYTTKRYYCPRTVCFDFKKIMKIVLLELKTRDPFPFTYKYHLRTANYKDKLAPLVQTFYMVEALIGSYR
jgi:hypothetical protein